eukprot:PhF_6_TR7981/c0_g1_i2/m.12210/K01256/pepN; aminopeptidase N
MKEILRSDYSPLPVQVQNVQLYVNIEDAITTVTSNITMQLTTSEGTEPLTLDGKELNLLSVSINGTPLNPNVDYTATPNTLTLLPECLKLYPSSPFTLTTIVHIKPQNNTQLEGLYKSSGMYSTQCEAEGFRAITYFFDRPDIMTTYTTTIEAKKESYPVLLSNGNLVSTSTSTTNPDRHIDVWHDPFPKPCYLFALVAGNLACKEDVFVTASGRSVALKIYTEPKHLQKLDHAMVSLKKSMKW